MVADHVLLATRHDVAPELLDKRLAGAGFEVRDRQPGSFVLAAFARSIEDPDELPRRIESLAMLEDLVEYAEPDHLVWPCADPGDPDFLGNKLWGLHNRGGVNGYTADADIDAPEAWDIRHDASDIIVAITDTGIRHDHEDLAPNMWRNPGEIAGDGLDNDGNGVIDDLFGLDAENGDGDPMDPQGHGTHCAGTIGARGDNELGLCGVAWTVRLMGGKFLGTNGGTTSDAIKVIDYARRMGAHVISASWGGGGYSKALSDAISDCGRAGIPFVAAAGNSGRDNDSSPFYPSNYNLPNLVAVAATDARDNLAYFSSYGRNSVDIAAPGWQIWSSYHRGVSDYRFLQGTSMATPHVSGALALARAHFPLDTVDQLIARLLRSADPVPALEGKVASGGRLNLFGLLSGSGYQAPNDLFDQAWLLEGDHATWSGSSRLATREPDEGTYSPATEDRTLWFAWRSPADGFVTVTSRSLGAGQRLVVFRGEDRQGVSVIADTGARPADAPESSARFFAEAGVPYRIVTASASATGEMFTLNLELTAANDLVSHAHLLTGDSFAYDGSNRGATAQPFETGKPHAGVGAGHSMWFRWIAPVSGPFTVFTEGSATDTVLAVYTGDPLDPAGFSPVAGNDDASDLELWSKVDFTAVQNTVYHIAVDTALGGTPGRFTLQGMEPGPPVISSQPSDVKVLPGGRALFSVGASGSPTLRYQWFRDGIALPGAIDRSWVVDPVTDGGFGEYHVQVSNSFGSVFSRAARLSEQAVAPEIFWQTGDQSALAGSPVELRIAARGTAPLRYEWRQNGLLIPHAVAPVFEIPSLSGADSGTYECRVSNSAGEASVSMVVTLVTSPFQSWEWRLEAMPGPAVTDIKVIDGKCYSVTGDRVMVSADGIHWDAWLLPGGFEGVAIAKLGDRWLCTGMNPLGSGRCAVSTDGISWNLQTPAGVIGVDGDPFSPLHHVTRLQIFNGRFIGQSSKRGGGYGVVVSSTDGVAWSQATLEGTTSPISLYAQFAVGPTMVVAGISAGPWSPTPYAVRTMDGLNWTRFDLPVAPGASPGNPGGAARWNGSFLLFSSSGATGWSSNDGIAWTQQTGRIWNGGIDVDGDFVSLAGNPSAGANGLAVAWHDSPWTASEFFVNPSTGDRFSAYTAFNGSVVYGTQRGFLGRLTGPGDLRSFGGNARVPTQLLFADGRFLALNASGRDNATPMVSGDGSNWRPMRPWPYDSVNRRFSAATLAGFAAGHFWGEHTGYDALAASNGLVPQAMPYDPVANGLPPSLQSIAEDGNTLLAISDRRLHRSTDGGNTWQEVTTAPVIGGAYKKARIIRSGSLWLLTDGDPPSSGQPGFVHHSTDGFSWTKTAAKPEFITVFQGKLFGLPSSISSLPGAVNAWESTDHGMTWTDVAFDAGNKLPDGEIRQLGVLGDSLVALTYSIIEGQSALRFSNDGRTWFRADAPRGVAGFATGLGQLVAYTNTGAIVQAGSAPAGGAAPFVRCDYPIHLSTAVAGSWVDITGEAFDPEGGAVHLTCHVDGEPVGTAGSGPFRFRFRAVSPAGHTIQLRATDAAGLVGSDELLVTVTPPQGTNRIDSAEGRDYLPGVALVELNGTFYAMGKSAILRSPDGLKWEPVLLPSLSTKFKGLAAGNGSLVAQTEWGVLYSTRDGVNWIQVAPRPNISYLVLQPVTFIGGRFLVTQIVNGQAGPSYQSSFNGLDWQSAVIPGNARAAVVGDNGVIVAIRENTTTTDIPVWSADGGLNWNSIPGIVHPAGQTIASAVAYADGVFLVATNDGRTWRSSDGRSWTAGTLPSPPGAGVVLRHAGGKFFAGSASHLRFASVDGVSWQPVASSVFADTVIHALGRYLARGDSGMVWSQDGLKWQDAQGGPTESIGNRIAFNGDRVLVIDSNGAAWSSGNGVVWRRDYEGQVGATDTSLQVGRQLVNFAGSLLLAGTNGMLSSSADDGESWRPGTVDGTAVPSAWSFNRVQASNNVALATAAIGISAEKIVVRSIDGQAWQSVSALSPHRIVDVAGNGSGHWIAAGANGAVFISTDNARTWAPVPGLPMATTRAVAWFKNEWLIFGALSSGAPSRTWSSTNGLNWTDRGANGMNYSNNEFFRIEAHGRLVVWNRTDSPVATQDGRVWQNFGNYSTWVANSLYWIAPNPSGFTLSTPPSSSRLADYFHGSPDGQAWTKLAPPQNDTQWGAAFENRLFLFSPGRIVEWPGADLEIELQPLATDTLGVGDFIGCPAVIRNIGDAPVAAALEADGWLSPDGFFGDGNDVYLGRIAVTAPAPAPGGQVSTTLRFELPGKVRPGNARLIAVLDPDGTFIERNRSNNVSITASEVVTVPQRKLTVLSHGNGTVSSDQSAEYHPHGARVAFFARPGKGARFSGWGGDAQGSLTETMVILDSDKIVHANFLSTTSLGVTSRGGGSVSQTSGDGVYFTGDVARLQATPLPGWAFAGWSGHLAGSNPEAFLSMDANKVVSALFTLDQASWAQIHFPPGDLADPLASAPDADPDGDGLANWREWLRGSNPGDNADRGLSTPRREGPWWVLTYSRMETFAAGHGVRCEASADLAAWTLPLDERIIGTSNGIETIEARIDTKGRPKAFMRLTEFRPSSGSAPD